MQFLKSLKERGLTGVRLVISDAHKGLLAGRGRCSRPSGNAAVHFYRNVLVHVPKRSQAEL